MKNIQKNNYWKEYKDMGNWKIEFIKSKKDSNPRDVNTYNWKLYVIIVLTWIIIVFVGLFFLLNLFKEPSKNSVRWIMAIVSFLITTPWLFFAFPLRTKSKLLKITDDNYFPKTDLDLDRYIIAMNYFGLYDKIPNKIIELNPTFISGYTKKKQLRKTKIGLFSNLFKNKKPK